MWLDAASESAGLENGSEWTEKTTAAANAVFRENNASETAHAFQNN